MGDVSDTKQNAVPLDDVLDGMAADDPEFASDLAEARDTKPNAAERAQRTQAEAWSSTNWVGQALNIAFAAAQGQTVEPSQRYQNIVRLADREWAQARADRDAPFQLIGDSMCWGWRCGLCGEEVDGGNRGPTRRSLERHMRTHLKVVQLDD